MDQPLKFNTGDRRIFSPAAHTVGWTVGRDRSLSFKYSNVPPQQLKGRTVVVVASLEGDVLAFKENAIRLVSALLDNNPAASASVSFG